MNMRRYLEPSANENTVYQNVWLHLQWYLEEILQPCIFTLKKRRQVEN